MNLIKHTLWVTDVDQEKGILYAEMRMDGDDFTKYLCEFEFEDLKTRVSESEFEGLIYMGAPMSKTSKSLPDLRQGRIFELHEDEDDEEYGKIHVPKFEPYTEEDIKRAEKQAEEWSRRMKEE